MTDSKMSTNSSLKSCNKNMNCDKRTNTHNFNNRLVEKNKCCDLLGQTLHFCISICGKLYKDL